MAAHSTRLGTIEIGLDLVIASMQGPPGDAPRRSIVGGSMLNRELVPKGL
jgi:hypothetical protein